MKRTLILFALIMLVTVAFAQFKKDRNAAYNAWQKPDLVKAKEAIDKAITYPEATTDAKVWYYRGGIYLDIQVQQPVALLLLAVREKGMCSSFWQKANECLFGNE